ncbi:MAG TPA: hypothetical protein VFB38_19015 [Chthonomonadaceae bacterium]|nr:hypothetical protein [Chthonomonadaceae bacterium]
MKKEIPPSIAAIIIVCVIALAGFVIWYKNLDRPIPEGPGIGRIGQGMKLGQNAMAGNPAAKPGNKKPAMAAPGHAGGEAKSTQ